MVRKGWTAIDVDLVVIQDETEGYLRRCEIRCLHRNVQQVRESQRIDEGIVGVFAYGNLS